MSTFFDKSIKLFFLFLIFFTPIINSHLLDLFLINWWFYVSWNYEFTKVIFFNIISSLIIILYLLMTICREWKYSFPTNSHFNLFLIIFWLTSLISTFFSVSPYISFFWNPVKWHSFLMWNNLILISYVLYNIIDKKFFKIINNTLIISALIVAIIWIKEFMFPSFEYLELSNRLISTFWHPNYTSLFFLLIIPYLISITEKEKSMIYKTFFWFLLFIVLIALFLTKSAIAIFLYLVYLIYITINKYNLKGNNFNFMNDNNRSLKQKIKLILYSSIIIIILVIIIFKYYPEKIHSFISRFYIWKTTLKIIFSEPKFLFTWLWFENLILFFDNFKSPELYIFENYWFSSDKPHNIFINFFVNLWITWLILILSIYYYIFSKFKNKKFYNYGLLLWSIFLLFNFASIASYLVIIIYLVYSLKKNNSKIKISLVSFIKWEIRWSFFIIFFIISVINIYFSTKFYLAEIYAYKNDYLMALKIFKYNPNYYYKNWVFEDWLNIWKIKTEKYFVLKIVYWNNVIYWCDNLLLNYTSVENYFYCWKILENFWYIKESNELYKKGLSKLPDLWNINSEYNDNFLIKNTVDKKRFFSEKYSPIKEILEKI